jgi:hypothetical protein
MKAHYRRPQSSISFVSTTSQDIPPPVRVSPDGTLIATSTNLLTTGPNPGTNILRNGRLCCHVHASLRLNYPRPAAP